MNCITFTDFKKAGLHDIEIFQTEIYRISVQYIYIYSKQIPWKTSLFMKLQPFR